VQEEQAEDDLARVELRLRHREAARALDLEQQVAAGHKLHDVVQAVRALEARLHRREVRVLVRQAQDVLLRHGAFDIVVFHEHVLLEDLDGDNRLVRLGLRKQDLAETPLAEDLEECVAVRSHLRRLLGAPFLGDPHGLADIAPLLGLVPG